MIIGPTICISGGIIDKETIKEINEDLIIKGKNYAILMDGATGLGGPRLDQDLTNAEWYVRNCGEFMKNVLDKYPDYDLASLVKDCIINIKEKIKNIEKEKGFTLLPHEEPSSTLIIVREYNNITDILSLGDSITMMRTKDKKFTVLRDYNLSALDNKVISEMKKLSKELDVNILETRNQDKIKAMLINNRNKKNSGLEGGYWILSLDENIINNAKIYKIPSREIEKIVCVSDGFNFHILNLSEEEFFDKCLPYNIITLAKKISDFEESDSTCNNYPRFKKRDDCSGFIWIPNLNNI